MNLRTCNGLVAGSALFLALACGCGEDDRPAHSNIEGLPYLSGYRPAVGQTGVTVYDRDKAEPGFRFYLSGHDHVAYLIDMRGQPVHRWARSPAEVWPELTEEQIKRAWRWAMPLPGGDVLVLCTGAGMFRLDRNSEIVWAWKANTHHHFDVTDDGTIYALTRKTRIFEGINPDHPIVEDFINTLDSGGQPIAEISVLQAVVGSEFKSLLSRAKRRGDIFHTNTVRVLQGGWGGGRDKAFRNGNLLVSMPYLDVVAIIHRRQHDVVWVFDGRGEGTRFSAQHDPVPLSNGNLLLFDNVGNDENTKIVEFDPVNGNEVWRFDRPDPEPWRSLLAGANERLPGGNTLISDCFYGRALEVSPAGEVVWRFINPHEAGEPRQKLLERLQRQAGTEGEDWSTERFQDLEEHLRSQNAGKLIASIPRMVRVAEAPWLKSATEPATRDEGDER